MKYPPTDGQADPDRRATAPHSDRARGIERPAGGPPGSPGEGSRGARRRLGERHPRPARRGKALPRGLPAVPAGPAEEDVPQASRLDRGPERRPRGGARSRRGPRPAAQADGWARRVASQRRRPRRAPRGGADRRGGRARGDARSPPARGPYRAARGANRDARAAGGTGRTHPRVRARAGARASARRARALGGRAAGSDARVPAPRAHREQAPALRDRALFAHARQGGPAAVPQRVAVPRRARRSPRRGFDGGDARDLYGRRVKGRTTRVGGPLREGYPQAPRCVAQGARARRQARAFVGRGAARGRGAAALSRSTHAGAVVFKLTDQGPRFLLVEASGRRDRWVFPKGHVENGETAADTAQREVGEEAGVRARTVRRLRRVEQKQEGHWISIAYFLMAYTGRATPLEERRIRWLSFDEAMDALDLEKSRRVLRSANRMISLPSGGEPPRPPRVLRVAARLAERIVGGALALTRPRGRRRQRRVRD